jgi:predicted dehydrogenase
MKTLSTVNWGIIGVGDVTEVKSGPAFYKTKNSNLVAVMRRDATKAADYARRHGVGKWYSDAAELIADPDVDAVYVATPPDSHARYAIEAMRAGKPVYVEKPMAKNHAECLEMLGVSEQTGMPLWVAYYRRTLPAFLKAKELLGAGEIGRPLRVNIRLYKQAGEENQSEEEMNWRVFPEIAGGGHFFDLASHQFDYLDFVLGKVTEVKGKAQNLGGLYAAEDTVSGSWTHESGVAGYGHWTFIANENSQKDEIEIIGEKGKLELSSFASPDLLKVTKEDRESVLEFNNPEHISQNLVQQLVNELRGEGRCVSTGESAARTNWVLEQMVRDYYSDKI